MNLSRASLTSELNFGKMSRTQPSSLSLRRCQPKHISPSSLFWSQNSRMPILVTSFVSDIGGVSDAFFRAATRLADDKLNFASLMMSISAAPSRLNALLSRFEQGWYIVGTLLHSANPAWEYSSDFSYASIFSRNVNIPCYCHYHWKTFANAEYIIS